MNVVVKCVVGQSVVIHSLGVHRYESICCDIECEDFHSKERQSCLTNILNKFNANNVSNNCQLILVIQY